MIRVLQAGRPAQHRRGDHQGRLPRPIPGRMYYVGKTAGPGGTPDRDLSRGDVACQSTLVRPGAHLGDIGHAIQTHTEAAGYSVVRELLRARAIGRVYHEDPQVLHYGEAGSGMELHAGMVFTIEPMINGRQSATTRVLPDGWTVGDQGSLALRTVGAHGAGDSGRPRSADAGRRGARRRCMNADPPPLSTKLPTASKSH